MSELAISTGDVRLDERTPAQVAATLRGADRRPIDVVVQDLSLSGCKILTAAPLKIGSYVSIGISGFRRRQMLIRRVAPGGFGCEFVERLERQPTAGLAFTATVLPLHIDGDAQRSPQVLPTVDYFLRRLRGPIILVGICTPWLLIGWLAMRLTSQGV